jgi:hypothetical protein
MATATRRVSVSVVAPETLLPMAAAVPQVVAHLRSCKLNSDFAIWVENNWQDLVRDPRLLTRPRAGGGTAAKTVASGWTPRVPRATISQPGSDPTTFPSDANLAAQAATLVAAAAQGAPFCPV